MNRCTAASPPRSVDDDAMTTCFVLLGDGAREENKDVFVAAEDVVREADERDENDLELEDDDEYWLRQQIDDDLESIHLRELLHDDDNDDLVQRLLLNDDSDNDVDHSVESEVKSTPVHRRSRKAVRVTFGEVHVREYSVTLGNHPLCQQYPLTLDWAHTEATTYDDMDQYEEACQLSARKLCLDRDERVRRLVNVTGMDSSAWEEREEFRMLDLLEERENEIEHDDDDDDDDSHDSHDSDDDHSLDLEEPGCDYEWSASSFNEVAATEAPTERTRRRVSFGPVQVQEYKVIHGEGNCLALVDGYEHDEEHGWLRTSYPSKLDYPVTLDWSHSTVQEFDLDWYESSKSQFECRYLQPNERQQRVRDMSGMNAGVLEWKERQRIQREKQQWLSQVLVELETASDDDCETEQAVEEQVADVSTLHVNVIVTASSPSRRRQRPVRRTHSSSKAAIAPIPRRRSPRLASQARCSYRV